MHLVVLIWYFKLVFVQGGFGSLGLTSLPLHMPEAPSDLIKMRQQKCFIRSVWYQVCLPVSMAP